MAFIALVPQNPGPDGKRRVANTTTVPGHSIRVQDGVETVRPEIWFAPEGYDALLLPDESEVGIGDVYENGRFFREVPAEQT